jgi:SAM-dependent methyltransferase
MGSSEAPESELDAVNRPVWSAYVDQFAASDCWTDAGERNILNALAPRLREKRILDVGVGAGRSTWLMQLLTADYVAIDYTPEMVVAASALHPGADIRLGDARDLADFPDGSVDAVMFSNNGIDALDDDDRQSALAEFFRVLRSGGILVYSALDKNGSAYGQAPWKRRDSTRSAPKRAVRFVVRVPENLPRYRREIANWNRLRHQAEDHGEWGIGVLSAHDYGLLVHFITPDGARREAERHGFRVESLVSDTGEVLTGPRAAVRHTYFHVVATKP